MLPEKIRKLRKDQKGYFQGVGRNGLTGERQIERQKQAIKALGQCHLTRF